VELEITYSCEHPECSNYAVIELNNVTNHGVDFIITPYTYTPSLQAVDAKYAEANAIVGPLQEVAFEGEITLDIPKEGLVVENGWSITPHTYSGVSLFYIAISVCYSRHSN